MHIFSMCIDRLASIDDAARARVHVCVYRISIVYATTCICCVRRTFARIDTSTHIIDYVVHAIFLFDSSSAKCVVHHDAAAAVTCAM